MPYLMIERTSIQVALEGGGEKAPEVLGNDSRAYAMNLRTTVRGERRNWQFNTKALPITTFEDIKALCANGVFVMLSGEAIGDPRVVSNGLTTPVGLGITPSTTGGALPAGARFYKVSAYNGIGETLASAEVTTTNTGASSKNTLAWTAVAGAVGYRLYIGTASGAEVGYIDVVGTNTFIHDGGIPLTSSTVTPPAAAVVGYLCRVLIGEGPHKKVKGTHRRVASLNARQVY